MKAHFPPDLLRATRHYGSVRVSPDLPPGFAAEVAALVERAGRGDQVAFQRLFRAHVAQVHRVVYRLVGPGPEIDDFVQTVFVEAFRSLPTFRGEALFSTWLTRIAVRVTMRGVRRRPPPAVSIDGAAELPAGTPGPERRAAAREALAALDLLLAELRPKRRVAFVLHVLEGHSMEEIAAMLNASVSAIKVRVHDARRHIERRLGRQPELLTVLSTGGRA